MQATADDRAEQVALTKALIAARRQFKAVHKDRQNDHLRNHYATLESVLDAVMDALLDNGIFATQTPVPIGDGAWALKSTLAHVEGGELVGMVPIEYGDIDERGVRVPPRGLNPMQALGSAISYARRYGLLTLLCLTAEDDDGATAGHGGGFPRQVQSPPPRGDQPRPRTPAGDHAPPEDRKDYGDAPPRSGRALFAWVKDQEQRHEVGLLQYLNKWGKLLGYPARMVDWDAAQVANAHMEAVRKVKAALAGRDGEDDEVDATAARDA